jgi:hypothetical protein
MLSPYGNSVIIDRKYRGMLNVYRLRLATGITGFQRAHGDTACRWAGAISDQHWICFVCFF